MVNNKISQSSAIEQQVEMAVNQEATPQRNCCNRLTDLIIGKFESAFSGLGKTIGKWPLVTILIAVGVAGLCGIGMLKFVQENRGEKLWNPQDSEALAHKAIVENRYPVASRLNVALFEGGNVLESQFIKAIFALDKRIKSMLNGTDKEWSKICYRQGPICQTGGILEIWGYNETVINSLTDAKIIADVNRSPLISLVTQRRITLERILGQMQRDSSSKITGAKAVKSTYFIKNQAKYDKSTGQNEDPSGKMWEEEFAKVVKNFDSGNAIVKLYYYTLTSFRAASGNAITGDIGFLSIGYFLIIGYLAIMLGKFTRLEHKAWLAVIGVLCIGLAILVSFGLSSAFGFFYGPVHSILPFLMLGIGVDDVFVIVQSYDNVARDLPKDATVPYIMAKTMKHAGMAISVTSMTDVIAFLVGATTVLPALQSFCVFAGLGILAVFFFACTIFAAALSLDIRRKGKRRDACCCCCISVSEDYKPFACAEVNRLQMFFDRVVAKYMFKLPVKVVLLIATAGLLGAGSYGLTGLKQDFDFNLFLPPDSDATKYNEISSKYYPNEGVTLAVHMGNIDYFREQKNVKMAIDKVYQNEYIVKSSVSSWYEGYISWLNKTKTNETTSKLDANNHPIDESFFYSWLQKYLNSTEGRIYRTDVTINTNRIKFSRFHATHIKMSDSATQVKAMDSVRKAISSVFSKEAFPYTRFYVGWETDKIIATELIRNLGLAGACVFVVTLFLLANIWTSLMVFTCVVLTLVDVGGMMYFWGLTIDTVTSVMLILAIGLCIDYAAHIGHSFMTSKASTRNERAASALSEIGPAVFNGGFSTFLAFVLLAASVSYVFKTFFKVFFLVVVFGLFHGLVYFPILLSLIGPKGYSTPDDTTKKSDVENSRNEKSPENSNGNVYIEAGTLPHSKSNEATQNGSVELQNKGFEKSRDDLSQ